MLNKERLINYITRIENIVSKIMKLGNDIILSYPTEYIRIINYTNNVNINDLLSSLDYNIMHIRKIKENITNTNYFQILKCLKHTKSAFEIIYNILIYLDNDYDIYIYKIKLIIEKLFKRIQLFSSFPINENIIVCFERFNTLEQYIDYQLFYIDDQLSKIS